MTTSDPSWNKVKLVCPQCGKPAAEAYKPFCSKRCADIDLNRWLSGTYAIPAEENDESVRDDSQEGSFD